MVHADEILNKQRSNALQWDKLFENRADIQTIKCTEASPNYWVYGVLVKNKKDYLTKFRKKGYYSSGVHINNNNYSVFRNQNELVGVNAFYKSFLAIPSGWWVKEVIL
jgi:hypothetical protein